MKNYTPEEWIAARKKLPRPVSDFFLSPEILEIYGGIATKLNLNISQNGLMRQVVNVTLLGLEPEHALETNLHQALPELPNASMRELVADINDRVFKEANRRLEQNIVTPEPPWNEAEWGPKPTDEDWEKFKRQEAADRESPFAAMSYEAIQATAEKEVAERRAKEEAAEAEAEKKRKPIIKKTAGEDEAGNITSLPPVTAEQKLGLLIDTGALDKKPGGEDNAAQAIQAISVISERLAAPTTEDRGSEPPIQATQKDTEPVQPVPVAPRSYKGNDPYREPIE